MIAAEAGAAILAARSRPVAALGLNAFGLPPRASQPRTGHVVLSRLVLSANQRRSETPNALRPMKPTRLGEMSFRIQEFTPQLITPQSPGRDE